MNKFTIDYMERDNENENEKLYKLYETIKYDNLIGKITAAISIIVTLSVFILVWVNSNVQGAIGAAILTFVSTIFIYIRFVKEGAEKYNLTFGQLEVLDAIESHLKKRRMKMTLENIQNVYYNLKAEVQLREE